MRPIDEPYIIDIEASGFGCDSYPIEIGLALDGGRKFCSLITPDETWTHWDEQAEQVHQISRETLLAHGKPIAAVADQLNDLLAGTTVYSDGWVVDKPWLSALFYTAGKSMDFRISPLEMILSEPQMEVWHATKDQVIAQLNVCRHRASNDAWIIQETYRQTTFQQLKVQRG